MPTDAPGGPRPDLAAALARLGADPADTPARLAFLAALSAAELCVWLQAEPAGDRLVPRRFDLDTGPTVLAFDSEAALAAFAGAAAPYAALPGRVLVAMLAGVGGVSLLVQSGDGAAELMPPEALDWLARTLAGPAPQPAQGRALSHGPPLLEPGVLAVLVPALERRLSGIPGLTAAALVQVAWDGGRSGPALALAGLPAAAEAPVARAVAEALELSGAGLDGLDVIFPPPATAAALVDIGLRLNPAPFVEPAAQPQPAAPGTDPARPPKLR